MTITHEDSIGSAIAFDTIVAVPLGRLLRYLNLLIAFALVIFLGVVSWFVWRVLPKTSGEIRAPISAAATITRDSIGVPHIRAGSIEDALFLQGYAQAQDRLWQMDALRRFAAGELAEAVGKSALDIDRETRRLRLRRLAEEHYRTVPAHDRAHLAAYARGVNHFIETHRRQLPLEFTLLSYEPRPWSVVDSILIGLHMYRDLTTSWKNDVQKSNLRAQGDKTLVDSLYPGRNGGDVQPGSNAWVLAGRHTASGKPILASDPHLEFAIPSTWYLAHLQAPGLNVSGATLAGLPGVIIGHNDRIAWGVTNLHYDVQDLFVEKLDPASGQYVYQGKVEQARSEREYIAVKDGDPVEFAGWVTRHGPIWANGNMSLKWTAAQAGLFEYPFIQLNMAKNWGEFVSALARFYGPGQNFVYADVDGNIGYRAAGKLPIRRNFDGSVPVDGSSGEYEWDGYIPFEQLPASFNPPSGIIISANQNPFPEAYGYTVSGSFAPRYRVEQIRARLTSKERWKPEEMLAIQKDVYSAFSHFLSKQVVAAYDRQGTRNPSLADAAELLRTWNGQMEKEQPAPLIISLIFQELRRAVADRAAPGQGSAYDSSMAPEVIEKLLRDRPKQWFTDYDTLLLRSFLDAMEEGRKLQGRNVKSWDYGVSIELNVRQPVGSRIPVVGPYFNIGPFPMSGSSTTVKQTSRRLGPSMRMVVDLGDWESSLQNITIGQSGQFLSWHYRDQWDAYYAGRSFPMRFNRVEGKTLRIQPTAVPGN